MDYLTLIEKKLQDLEPSLAEEIDLDLVLGELNKFERSRVWEFAYYLSCVEVTAIPEHWSERDYQQLCLMLTELIHSECDAWLSRLADPTTVRIYPMLQAALDWLQWQRARSLQSNAADPEIEPKPKSVAQLCDLVRGDYATVEELGRAHSWLTHLRTTPLRYALYKTSIKEIDAALLLIDDTLIQAQALAEDEQEHKRLRVSE